MSANTIVRTAWLQDSGCLLHLLIDGSDGSLSATALDTYLDINTQDQVFVSECPIPEIAQPKSLPSKPLISENTRVLIESGQGILTHRSIVPPAECDLDGFLLDQFHISRFSDAASHLWDAKGLSRKWLLERNYGGAAVEMKATRCNPVRADMALEVTSWVFACSGKTLSFRHQVRDMSTDDVVYNGAATALIFDLSARKAVSLPSGVAENLAAHQSTL